MCAPKNQKTLSHLFLFKVSYFCLRSLENTRISVISINPWAPITTLIFKLWSVLIVKVAKVIPVGGGWHCVAASEVTSAPIVIIIVCEEMVGVPVVIILSMVQKPGIVMEVVLHIWVNSSWSYSWDERLWDRWLQEGVFQVFWVGFVPILLPFWPLSWYFRRSNFWSNWFNFWFGFSFSSKKLKLLPYLTK